MKAKRILSVLLCACMVFIFAGCESEQEKQAGAKAAAEGFITAIFNLDIPEASKYTVEGDEFIKKVPGISKDEFYSAVNEGMGDMAEYADSFQVVFDTLFDGILSTFKYEISEILADGDKYRVSGTVKHIDFDSIGADTVREEGVTDQEAAQKILNEMISSGKYNEQASEEELMGTMMDMLSEKMASNIENNLAKMDTITEDFKLIVERPEDKWLVNYSESDLSSFITSLDKLEE